MKKVIIFSFLFFFLNLFHAVISAQLIQGSDGIPVIPEGRYDVPTSTDSEYTGGIFYIDPTSSNNGNGSVDSPFNSWENVVIKANTAYLQKRGTKAKGNLVLNTDAEHILIGAYGEGARPDLNLHPDHEFRFMGHYSVLRDVKVGKPLRMGSYNNSRENMWVYNCEFDLQNGEGICIVNWSSNNKIIGNHMHHSLSDGIFCQDVDGGGAGNEIAYNYIHDINMNYMNDPSEKGSPGDVIQISSGTNVHIHHNVLDHSSSGNKFGIIVRDENKFYGGNPMEILIEENIIFLPKPGSNGCAGIYLQEKQKSIIRYNQIIGREKDDDNAGIVVRSSGTDIEIYGNLMVNIAQDINTTEPVKVFNNTFVDIQNGDINYWEQVNNNILSKKADGINGSNLFIDVEGSDNLFQNAAAGDYSLKSNSSAVDAGTDVGLTRDLFGTAIPQNGLPDIGAIEFTTNPSGNTEVNQKPIADAGDNLTIKSGAVVTLDGSGSTDPEGQSISYAWSAGSAIVLDDPLSINPSFTTPFVFNETVFEITLQVNDGVYSSDISRVFVTVLPDNEAINKLKKIKVMNVAASTHDGNAPENTIDSVLMTRWSAEGESQWIEYDLEAQETLKYMRTAWYKGDERKSYFDVEVSDDGATWRKIMYDAETDGKTAGFQTFTLDEANGRYIRILGYGNSSNKWNSLCEVEFYGSSDENTISTNITPQRPVQELKIYPNPVKSNHPVQIEINGTPIQEALELFDMSGRKIRTLLPLEALPNDLPTGIYVISFRFENELYREKIIVK